MKILFIVPYYKPAYVYGGPIVVVSMLAELLVSMGHDVCVYTTVANGKTDLQVEKNKEIIVDGVKVVYFNTITANNAFISVDLWRAVHKNATDFDVVHIHTWWNFLVVFSALICKRKNIKPLISPHGMFSNYILNKSNVFAKRVVQKLVGKRLLENSWLHVSSRMEWNESQNIVQGWKGKIISNLVKLSNKEYKKTKNEVFTIGFLSRIDPKKGLDLLIESLSQVNFPYRLLVAGSGEDEYVNSLKQLSIKLKNDKHIDWLGWVGGEDKFEFLNQLDLFALISHSENFAIVIIESLSVGTPVLITDNIGLYTYVEEHNYGWVTDLKVANVVDQLNTIYTEKHKIEFINLTAPAEIAKNFEDSVIADQYLELYNLILKDSQHAN